MSSMDNTGTHSVRQPKPMAWKGLVFLGVLLAICAVFAVFVISQRSVEGPLVASAEPAPLSVNTQTVVLQAGFDADERFTGLVTPRRTSQLGFASSGRIDSLKVDVGDRVAKGRTLGQLDTRGLRAQLAAAEAVVREAEASHDLALNTVERQTKLSAQGHVSNQAVDEATAVAATAFARITAAQANADTLKVQIDLARIDAPFAGVITSRMADEGAIAGPGQPIFELVEAGQLEARIGLTEALARRLEIGKTYKLNAGERQVDAVLRSVTGVIDAQNRTVTSVFTIVDTEQVAAGTVVRLGMDRRVEERGFWLPVSALTEREHGLWAVYVARREGEDWIAKPGTVEVIHTDGARAYVRGAVRDGDQVILDGLQRITPEQKIRPVEITQTASKDGNG
ncbi:MAG: efflux RND transporter periplasmic adaptor subunit [Henriciella sp.]